MFPCGGAWCASWGVVAKYCAFGCARNGIGRKSVDPLLQCTSSTRVLLSSAELVQMKLCRLKCYDLQRAYSVVDDDGTNGAREWLRIYQPHIMHVLAP